MKGNLMNFINTKIGYSSGTYGCTGEYFLLHAYRGDELSEHLSIRYVGMYGVEERVAEPLKKAGFGEVWVGTSLGKLTGQDKRGFVSEAEAIKKVTEWVGAK